MNLTNTLISELIRLEANDSNQLVNQAKLVIRSFLITNPDMIGNLELAVGIIKSDKVRLKSTNTTDVLISQVERLLKEGIDYYITLSIKKNKAHLFIQDYNYDAEIEFSNGKEQLLLFHDYSLQNKQTIELTPELLKSARLEIISEIRNPKKQNAA
jgi:hypothetical protein